MTLPTQDVEFLRRRGYEYELVPCGSETLLIVKKFNVAGGGFSPPETELMVRLPDGYPMASLDMWYCDPPVRRNGQDPNGTSIVTVGGRTWQQFSRHLNGTWRPGIDCLRSYFRFIEEELQGRGAGAAHANAH